MKNTGKHGMGANVDNETKIILDEFRRRIVKLEKRQALYERYFDAVGVETGGASGHLKKITELTSDLRSDLKKIE